MIAIFDIGKTNKKLSLLDENYRFVDERSVQFPESKDEDGDPCDDLSAMTAWMKSSLKDLTDKFGPSVKAVNYSGYGASFVHVDTSGSAITPLYNYLKPFPPLLKNEFYSAWGGEAEVAKVTASPVLGHLNSGLQVYRIKKNLPEIYARIRYALHLPQYLSYIFTGIPYSEMTSIGCHTHLWDFTKSRYHDWVLKEGIVEKLAPVVQGDHTEKIRFNGQDLISGIGLHDSSSALIPYLKIIKEPFLLISTGTWCISLNPFNNTPLTSDELQQDCLCYMTHEGDPVKASRLFAGQWHEEETRKLASLFNKDPHFFEQVQYNKAITEKHMQEYPELRPGTPDGPIDNLSGLVPVDYTRFPDYESAYHHLLLRLTKKQVISSGLILKGTDIKNMYVDGGFSRNALYMNMLASAFPGMKVFAASVPQASTIGAAIILHQVWNNGGLPANLVTAKEINPGT